MKSKFVFGLLAAMLVLVLAPSSFAQITITINNVPAAQEIQNNRTAETSDTTSAGAGITVSGALVAQSNLSMTDLLLTFPGTITSDIDQPAGDPLRIDAATGVFSTAFISTKTGSTLRISLLNADITGNTQSGSFRILGLRINANGLTAPANGSASLSNSANNFFLGTASYPLINALGPGIASLQLGSVPGGTDMNVIQIFTNRNVTNGTASVVIREGFPGAWRSDAQNEIDVPGAAGVGPMQIRLTIEGLLDGVPISCTTVESDDSPDLDVSPCPDTFADDDGDDDVTLTILGSDLDEIEEFQVNFDIGSGPLSDTPAPGDFTLTATMAPVATSTTVSDSNVPLFTAVEVGPITIGSIVQANTTLLITYALRQGPFDTGIQIANTTADPFGTAFGGATPTAGNLRFDFFPRNPAGGAGTPFSLTTSSSTVFGGLSSDGTLAAGGSFVALLSEILSRTSFTGDFSGYIFVRANFLGAHGTSTISDFRSYSLATNVLVLPPPATRSRNTPLDGFETLSF